MSQLDVFNPLKEHTFKFKEGDKVKIILESYLLSIETIYTIKRRIWDNEIGAYYFFNEGNNLGCVEEHLGLVN
jgi:hypothetical protein